MYFVTAGVAGGLLLSALAFHAFRVDWISVGIVSLVGVLASTTDVLIFRRNSPQKAKSCLFWVFGFPMLTLIMWIGLLIPYVMLALVSKAFGVWEALETVGANGQWLAIPVGGAFGLMVWHLLDDY